MFKPLASTHVHAPVLKSTKMEFQKVVCTIDESSGETSFSARDTLVGHLQDTPFVNGTMKNAYQMERTLNMSQSNSFTCVIQISSHHCTPGLHQPFRLKTTTHKYKLNAHGFTKPNGFLMHSMNTAADLTLWLINVSL
ncbi:hypothetical protein P691DRAFT_766247 [Macrolepiota fuliginosa MF-IS2]|uniref:Uncharacterized protein n=1 Tax=Macrolepiota fuliginosa MF-IS2 TaxID=1400762 RepID=A0A9P5WYI6_9AGAR|nr:hypothetical protein P691DRAFT_766247 [Macrolepiota fuliginosa MF-IS2]